MSLAFHSAKYDLEEDSLKRHCLVLPPLTIFFSRGLDGHHGFVKTVFFEYLFTLRNDQQICTNHSENATS